jgi:undecaprenyl-diphosphatase
VSEFDYLKAMVLGIVQGATEFLPVSSSGHLAIIQDLFALEADSPQMLLFDVLAHVGTLVAVFIVFAHSAGRYLRRLLAETSSSWTKRRHAWRIALLGVAASVPTAAIGLAFKDFFEGAFGKKWLIALCLIITGILLSGTLLVRKPKRGWGQFGIIHAALVGVAQGLAILPGISRSGTTICVACYIGLRRRWAGEFSFFIAVPAIIGATAFKIKDTFDLSREEFASIAWGPTIVGAVVSLIVGVFALRALLDVVRRAKLHYFALYCWLLGLAILAWWVLEAR